MKKIVGMVVGAALVLASVSVALAGTVTGALFNNITGTETLTQNSVAIKCAEAVNIQVVMSNYTGSVAVQASIDSGTTFFTYTTVPAGNANALYRFPVSIAITNIKAVPTDTYTTDTSRGNVDAAFSYRECH